MELGAKPSPLDHISMADWLTNQRFDSPTLRWYVNYACRDDYGAWAKDTAAWAGIHYFASREPEEKGPLTLPEGNGWIAQQLIGKLARYIHSDAVVYRVARNKNRLQIFTERTEYIAEAVIFAAPTFLAFEGCGANRVHLHFENALHCLLDLSLARADSDFEHQRRFGFLHAQSLFGDHRTANDLIRRLHYATSASRRFGADAFSESCSFSSAGRAKIALSYRSR